MDAIDVLNKIPIIISLQYDRYFLKFQVNPQNLKKSIPSESTTVNIEGLGEVGIPTTPKLARIDLRSFFWQDRNLIPVSFYVTWLERWQKSKKPAKLIITRLNYSMYVTCESFSHERRAGEENDIYYELSLQEYRPYGAKKIGVQTPLGLFDKLLQLGDDLTLPVLIDIPRPDRSNSSKEKIENPYKTKENENLISITKKIRGTSAGWKDLYEENKVALGNIIAEGNEIPANIELTIPSGWL